jgi:hypothetical protein
MSKLKDNEIIALQKEVEAKKDRVSKLKSKFAPETTCTFTGINLHTQKIEGLIDVLSRLIISKNAWEEACKLSKVELEFTQQGFTFEQWKHDILFLIDRYNLKQMEEELSEDIEFLDSLVSKETKNKAKFNKIKEKHQNE